MTRKTVSERRIAGANKQIGELTEALGFERDLVTKLKVDCDFQRKSNKVLAAELAGRLQDLDAARNSNDRLTAQNDHLRDSCGRKSERIRDVAQRYAEAIGEAKGELAAAQEALQEENTAHGVTRDNLAIVRDKVEGYKGYRTGFYILVAAAVLQIIAELIPA